MDTISVKVKNEGNINKYISIIRKETGKPIIEIKKMIENSHKVIQCDYYENEEVNRIILVSEELMKNGAIIEIYENNRVINLENLKNLINTYQEIEEEREQFDEIVYGND